ncbi:MAG: hypothetical protein ACXWE8_12810 [Solirubrobacterales bacterium]
MGSLLIAMGATASSAVAAPASSSADVSQADAGGQETTMFGVTFNLVLLSGTGCPPALGHSPYACAEYTAVTPIVYMRDDLDRYTRRYALRHEVGHIVCWRTQADTSEKCADRWAKAHMPSKKKKKKRAARR